MKLLSSKQGKFLLAALSALAVSPVFAEEATKLSGQIDFTGKVVADSCRLSSSNGDATSVKVDMGTVSVEDIGTVADPKFTGSGSSQVNFSIICKTASKVSMNLAGLAPEVVNGNILRVNNGTQSPGFARGVGIALYDSAVSTNPKAYDLTNGALLKEEAAGTANEVRKVSFAAAYVANGTPTAGIANASLPFTLTYE
ncbi:type 1 fimbrial protein [Chromobacterium haemolyticum]|uniref:Type 1 fimbrial protein n=1 Tax=Chromobacterium fluminis TaxID=3044269 RepID=A0ABX0LEP0_9NEIS|nr:fimbrial protein [Chromobacterium haemolyticum]NHR05792.1 type 1 fimbrial protein [Chromobacterium haemolyticum]